MEKKITYEDYQNLSGTSVLNAGQALDLFEQIIWSESAFLTVFMNDVNTLQIMTHGDQFIIEITNDSEDMVFYQKYAPLQACKELLVESIETGNIAALADFYPVPITSKTLDQVMSGK